MPEHPQLASDRAVLAVTLLTLVCTGGCATIVKGTSQVVTVSTDPPGAGCSLSRRGESIGTIDPTPSSLQLEKSKDDVEISCKKDGYLDASAKLPSSLEGWTFGNIVVGGLIGIVVDAGSGAMHRYQASIHVSLSPEEFKSVAQRDAFFDAWRTEVTRDAERVRQEIAKTCTGTQCQDLMRKADSQTELALAQIEVSRARAKLEEATKAAAAAVTQAKPPGNVSASTFLKPGDKWKYTLNHRGRDLGLVTVEIDMADGSKVSERITMDGFKAYQAQRTVGEPFSATRFQSVVVLPGGYQLAEIAPYFPPGTAMEVGQKWEQVPGEINILGAGKRAFFSEVTVTHREKVRVPAGEFDAWRIESVSDKVSYAGTGNATQVKCTFWYSPAMQRTVKMSMTIDTPIIAAQASETYELRVFEPAR